MIVDGHLDLACNALVDGRDSTRSALAIPAEEAGGPIETPDELDTVGDHRKIGEALAARGWSADDVAGVLGGNWLRVLGGLYA